MNTAYEKYGYKLAEEKKSIEKYLTNLSDFLDLLDLRSDLHHKNGFTLGDFYVLNGKYHLDQFGQIGKVLDGMTQMSKFFDIPLLMSDYEMHEIRKAYNKKINAVTREETEGLSWDEIDKLHENRPYELGISISLGNSSIPEKNTICPYCEKGWDINNIDDCIKTRSEWKDFPIKEMGLYEMLYDFKGQPISKFWDFIQMRTDAIYHQITDNGSSVNNPKWIDDTPDPKYPTCKMNEGGFYKGKIDENYILQDGDHVNFLVSKYFHKDCNKKNLKETETEKFKECFENAGFKKIKLLPIPNEYCQCDICTDWFNVVTKFGVIKIGWRKHVINIDWSDCYSDEADGTKIFQEEDVTKDKNYIHAWSWEKCTEYLIKLRKSFEYISKHI